MIKRTQRIQEEHQCSCPHDHDDQAPEIAIKKKFGQHFLRDELVIDKIVESVQLNAASSVFEIGCGDGALTSAILAQKPKRLWVFEIDPEWADYVRATYSDAALTIFQEDILHVDLQRFEEHAPWTLMANLPYQITFPILYKLQAYRHLFSEIVIMIQEEVAQKLLATSGRSYGVHSLFFQHYFVWKSVCHVPPTAFMPPPKVHSRVVHAQPRAVVPEIIHEELFWKFAKSCFAQPRRTFLNNLLATPYAQKAQRTKQWHHLRAQQMTFNDFMAIWQLLQEK